MRTISATDLSRRTAAWIKKRVRAQRDMVVTRWGKPFAILVRIDGSAKETLSLVRQARVIAATQSIRRRSLALGLNKLTMKEINAEIAAVRAARRRRQPPR